MGIPGPVVTNARGGVRVEEGKTFELPLGMELAFGEPDSF